MSLMRPLAIAGLFLVCAGASVGQGAPERAAEFVVASFHSALAQKDHGRALAALSPGVVIYEAGEAELSREEYAAHHLDADMQFTAATKTDLRERTSHVTGDLAWVISRTITTGAFNGKQLNVEGTETMILERTSEGRWEIVHIHWSSHSAALK